MNDKTLDDLMLEVEAHKAVEDIMQEDAARMNAKITMLANRLTENMQRVLAKTGSEPVAIDVLPDGEAQDDEGEDTENL